MTSGYDTRDPDFSLSRSVEGGPAEYGDTSKAQEMLALHRDSSRYDALQAAFGAREDGIDPLADWNGASVEEFLRGSVGAAEDFARDYDAMTEEERDELFPDPTVAELVALWAQKGREIHD